MRTFSFSFSQNQKPDYKIKKIIVSIVLLCTSIQANATTWIEVDDASKLLCQMTATGTVWFRNLNELDSSHGGCCYAYKLDTTTPGGKSIWSTLLAKMAASKRSTLGFPKIGSNENVQILSAIGRLSHGSNQ